MKRQSTVAKLSTVTLRNLITFCRSFRCGIILRIAGEEMGYTVDELEGMLQQAKIYGFARYFKAFDCPIPTLRKDWWQAWGGVFGVHAYSELSDCEIQNFDRQHNPQAFQQPTTIRVG